MFGVGFLLALPADVQHSFGEVQYIFLVEALPFLVFHLDDQVDQPVSGLFCFSLVFIGTVAADNIFPVGFVFGNEEDLADQFRLQFFDNMKPIISTNPLSLLLGFTGLLFIGLCYAL